METMSAHNRVNNENIRKEHSADTTTYEDQRKISQGSTERPCFGDGWQQNWVDGHRRQTKPKNGTGEKDDNERENIDRDETQKQKRIKR